MLKDSQPKYQPPTTSSLSVSFNLEVDKILEFVDNNIGAFRPFYEKNKDSLLENWASNLLVRHFQLCNVEQGGYLPYDFSKNPPQEKSSKETDIGVYVNTRSAKQIPIMEFEAKRFYDKANNKEYVSGERGGIERFKRGYHSSHLSICGMLGYVLTPKPLDWITKVNGWIDEEANNNLDTTIDWKTKDEKLKPINSWVNIEKLKSEHTRKQSNDSILLFHYFINLC